MIGHIATVILIALTAHGAHTVQQEGMILERLGRLFSKTHADKWIIVEGKKVPKPYIPFFWQKPLWTCPPCMCSAWGIPVALIVSPDLWSFLPIHLFAAAGIAAYLNK